ncbi:MBL fold metallo-hydrolase [Nocardioides sp. zg-1228]|uniref:MBL fold metallo-hydrolase n=1 Tax=Nocardioides sp. zg-1228 TaxID=2763008 RepID=UPI001643125C|nr:MBL fold metallo-hydrolase [Nocardioides sp. zg-1228]MBC2934356.1 MBL fold metallo-hydrolase [Nocardioides sp. zg-1228]QSF59132.1 MBL fold metallo-hydrolase [Nocardioides sp. zg-1228]
MRASGDRLRLTWLGHSTVVIDLAGCRLLTDPLLRTHNNVLRRRAVPPSREQWADPDAVLLSHLHLDHAEVRSLRMVAGVPVLTGSRNAAWLRGKGLLGQGAEDWTDVGPVRVRLVPAVHHGRPMPHRPNEAHGHLVRSDATTLWVAGDTAWYDGMADLPALAGAERVDVAIVPIGGWGPRLSANHMGPAQAARACAATGARYALPVHWGTLHAPLMTTFGDWFERPLAAFEAEVAATAPDCRVITVEHGETWSPAGDT